MAGQDFDLTDNSKILSISSPRKLVNGPYAVVYKNIKERWAIVALEWNGMEWNKEPSLGIRWFWDSIQWNLFIYCKLSIKEGSIRSIKIKNFKFDRQSNY